MRHKLITTTIALGLSAISSYTQATQTLNFYNWSDYIAEDTIQKFEKETGIKVNSDVFDSSEVLESKLLTGRSGYDVVVPNAAFMGRHIKANLYSPLKKTKLDNFKNLDEDLLKAAATQDPNNIHAVPYLWGTTGIGINVDKVKEVLGASAPTNSWSLIFDVDNIKKLAKCGVSVLDTPDELYPLALHYLGKDPSSKHFQDYKPNSEAANLLKSIRPFIGHFHSSAYINNLANGDICIAIGYSGDILQAKSRAQEANNGVNIEYVIPEEGTAVWFDLLAIPSDAPNKQAAHSFINFMMRPDIIADITNYVSYANANKAATELQDSSISNNPGIYPNKEIKQRLFMTDERSPKITKALTRFWTNLKANRS